jgi:hypothetical protein
MSKYIWLIVLTLPIWAAVEFDAPKWMLMLTVVAFYVRAATLGDHPDEHLLGEGFAKYRPSIIVVLGLGGLILGAALLVFVRALL